MLIHNGEIGSAHWQIISTLTAVRTIDHKRPTTGKYNNNSVINAT